MRENRKLALEIARIKAPKRRRGGKTAGGESNSQPKAGKSSCTKDSSCALGASSVLSKSSTPEMPASLQPDRAIGEALMTQSLTTHIGLPEPNPITENATEMLQPISQQKSGEISVPDTCEWLIDAGVPFSAFDPVDFRARSCHPPHEKKEMAAELTQFAEEITSLFSSPCHTVPEHEGMDSPWCSAICTRQNGQNIPYAQLSESLLGAFGGCDNVALEI